VPKAGRAQARVAPTSCRRFFWRSSGIPTTEERDSATMPCAAASNGVGSIHRRDCPRRSARCEHDALNTSTESPGHGRSGGSGSRFCAGLRLRAARRRRRWAYGRWRGVRRRRWTLGRRRQLAFRARFFSFRASSLDSTSSIAASGFIRAAFQFGIWQRSHPRAVFRQTVFRFAGQPDHFRDAR